MKVEMPHELSVEEARDRMKDLTAYWRRKYAVESRWRDDVARMSGSFLGVTFEATLAVAAHTVIVDGPDPGALLRGQATDYLTRKLHHYLAPRAMRAAQRLSRRSSVPAH
jgi:putative polyhydroxyalkanoic acid system protein